MEVTYPLLSTDGSSLQPNVRVAFCDSSSVFLRNCTVSTCNDIELKCDQPPCYMFILSSVTMEYVMRARCNRAVRSFASVYFEKDRSFLRARYETRPRLYLVKYIHILFYILYPLTLVGYLLFSFSSERY